MYVVKESKFDQKVTNLIILHVILFEYAEGHHDPPLVTLFVVTELDLCRHDPDGMSFDIIININYVCSEKV